jgi:hypothetical protein
VIWELQKKKYLIINKNYYPGIGFPIKYYEGEVLSNEEAYNRFRLIYIRLMSVICNTSPLISPSISVVLTIFLNKPSIEKIKTNEVSYQFKHFLKIESKSIENPDKIILTKKQIKQCNFFAKQVMKNDITVDQAILKIRAEDGVTDIVIMLFLGLIHGLPVNENGKTAKTEENVIGLRNSLVNMVNKENSVWFDQRMYQGGTERGYGSMNIYDQDKRVIAIYKKAQEGK